MDTTLPDEKQEFDAWTGDTISSLADPHLLQRAAAYYRREGIHPTALVVEARLAQLLGSHGSSTASTSTDSPDVAAELRSFQEACQHKAAPSLKLPAVAELQPPVRGSLKGTSKAPAPSTSRRNEDLTDQALSAAEPPLLGGAELQISSSSSSSSKGKAAMPGAPKAGAALVQEVEARGAQRTRQLLAANAHLGAAERAALADAERLKGNEGLKAGNAAEAVEHYSVCIGLDSTSIPAHTNRALAFVKLRQWDSAAADCTRALSLADAAEAAAGGAAGDVASLRIKALMRRVTARMNSKQQQLAWQDCLALQQLAPGDRDVQQLVERTAKALGPQQQQQQQGAAAKAAAPAAAAAPTPAVASAAQHRMTIVEQPESDDDDDASSRTPPAQQQQQRQTRQQPAGGGGGVSGSSNPSSGSGEQGSSEGAESDDEQSDDSGYDGVETAAAAAAVAAAAAAQPPPDCVTYEAELQRLQALADAASRAGTPAQAVPAYHDVLSHAPADVTALTGLAAAQLQAGRHEAAMEACTLALGIDPRSAEAYFLRARAKQQIGDNKGAEADLRSFATSAPAHQQGAAKAALAAHQRASAAAAAQAQAAAAAARRAGRATYASCVIEEEVEDPAEAQQRLHRDNSSKQVTWMRQAARAKQQGAEKRAAWEADVQARMQQWRQQQEQAAAEAAAAAAAAAALKQQKQRLREKKQPAQQAGSGSAWAEKVQQRSARLADAAAAAAGIVSPRRVAAVPPTPASTPAKPLEQPQEQQQHSLAAAASAVLSQQTPGKEQQQPVSSSGSDATAAAAAEGGSAAERLRLQGNELMTQGQPEGARAAYVEALSLDGDNVKVLLNLALLELQEKRFATALRACDEVLALEGASAELTEERKLKALHRRALALAGVGRPDDALRLLATVKEQLSDGGAIEQLNKGIIAVSDAVHLQRTQEQEAQQRAARAAAREAAQREREQRQQQAQASAPGVPKAPAAAAAAAAPAAAPAVSADPAAAAAPAPAVVAPGPSPRTFVAIHFMEDDSDSEEGGSGPDAGGAAAAAAGSAGAGVSSDAADDASEQTVSDGELMSPPAAAGSPGAREQQQQQLHLEPTPELGGEPWHHVTAADAASPSGSSSGSGGGSAPAATAATAAAASTSEDLLDTSAHALEALAAMTDLLQLGGALGEQQQQQQALMMRLLALMGARGADAASEDPQHDAQMDAWARDVLAAAADKAAGRDVCLDDSLVLDSLLPIAQQTLKHSAEKAAAQQRAGVEQLTLQQQVAAVVARGAEALARGSTQEALRCSNAAVQADASNVSALALRAQVNGKLKRHAKAEEDCTAALAALAAEAGGSSSGVRCQLLHRRALALREQGKFKEALADVKQLLVLQPSSDAAQRLQEGLRGQYRQQLEALLTPKAQEDQQQQDKQDEEDKEAAAAAADTDSAAGARAAAVPEPVVHIHRVQIVEDSDSDDDDALPEGAELLLRVTPPQQQQQQQQQQQPTQEQEAAGSKAGGSKAGTQPPRRLTAPRTSAEFVTTARSLAGSGDTQQLGAYVQLLPPGQYAALFRSNLEPQSLGLMLQGLDQLAVREPGAAASGLAALPAVPRFGVVWAMADGASKARARALLGQLAASGMDVGGSLRAAYGVRDAARK